MKLCKLDRYMQKIETSYFLTEYTQQTQNALKLTYKTCMNNPRIWTMVWGMTGGAGSGWAEEGKGGKLGHL